MSQTKVKSGLLNFPDQTDFVKLPSGTTAQRPVSPEEGYTRFNTTDNKLEFWNGTVWQQLPGVVAPIITSVSYPGDDLAADPVGGQTITINGSDFKTGATVTVGGTTPSVITFVSATEITFEAPAKAAGDYDVVVTNTDGGNATAVNGMAYNGVPSWTTPAGNLGTFPAGSTIPTITLVATEPDSGVISYSITTGALPTGLALTGADIDGNVPSPAGETTYNFSVTASDDENQSTERAFNIVVYLQVTNTVSTVDPFGDSSGVALYRLENNANDEGGVYNGTPTNVTYGTGVFGQAGVFNGSNSFIEINSFNAINGNSARTVTFWCRLTTNDSCVTAFGTESANQGWAICPSQYSINVYGHTASYDETLTGFTTDLTSGKWVFIAVTYSGDIGGVLKGYANGNLESVKNRAAGTSYNTVSGLTIGKRSFRYVNGQIDQVRVFNKELTPLEVSSLYEERTVICGGQAETVDILGDNSCIALYPLDGNANDLSGNYSGTPTDVSYGVGEFDLAGVFNGSSSVITLPSALSDGVTTDATCISFWFNVGSEITSATPGNEIMNFAQSSSNFGKIAIGSTTGNFAGETFSVSSDVTSQYTYITENIPAGWNHAVVQWNSSTAKWDIYINSVAKSTNTFGINEQGKFALKFGNRSSFYFNGSLDQVRIFNKALSAGEVTTLYNETACDVLACSGTTNTLDILGDSSCIAAYPLDGSPLDLSGNYNGVQTDVTYPVGKFDLGAVANGTSTRINTGYIQNGQVFSVSFWGRNFSAYGSIIRDTPAAGGANTRINIVSNASGGIALAGNYAVDSSTTGKTVWTHYVVTANGSVAKIYENTVEVASVSYSEAGGNNGTPVCMFSNGLYPVGFGEGELDQVRIFNKALSAGEVTTLYNETACN